MARNRADVLAQIAVDSARVRKIEAELLRARELLVETARRARSAGKTLQEIGDASGYSKQRVAQMTEVKPVPTAQLDAEDRARGEGGNR